MAAITANANFMLHAGGWDEAGMVHCINKLVVDAEQNLMLARYAQGVSFDLLEEAMEAVRRVGPGSHYLGDPFTLKHFRDAFFAPELLNYEAYEHWQLSGSKDLNQRAADKVGKLLADYQQPHLDVAIDEALQGYIAQREEQIYPRLG
jgi:trimethylamine--corrinoid protein Co-methyltransferase